MLWREKLNGKATESCYGQNLASTSVGKMSPWKHPNFLGATFKKVNGGLGGWNAKPNTSQTNGNLVSFRKIVGIVANIKRHWR